MIRYSKDSRTIQLGEYYVAIRGERFDGHDFILDAIANGAAGLVVERDISHLLIPAHIDIRQVSDSNEYLARKANQRILELNPDVVAITGSVGKTTTKNAVATILAQAFPVTASKGNLNTPLGLSLTILNQLTGPDNKLVVEMGAYSVGELAHLCGIAPPSVSVVTNVRPVHLETMGSIENVTLAKGEIVEALPVSGLACLNFDDPRVRQMVARSRGRVLYYGTNSEADINPGHISVDIPLLGRHAIYIALAAYCVGRCFDMPAELINQGIASLQPEKGRLVKLPGIHESILIDDTYNASPLATFSALDVLSDEPANRRFAFLGDMLELGPIEEKEHQWVVKYAFEAADVLVLVGPRFEAAFETLKGKKPAGKQTYLFEKSEDAVTALQTKHFPEPKKGDSVLIKGSAGMRMERIVRQLLAPHVNPAEVLARQDASWKEI